MYGLPDNLTRFLAVALCLTASVPARASRLSAGSDVDPPGAANFAVATPADRKAVLAANLAVLFKKWKAVPNAKVGIEVSAIRKQIDRVLAGYVIMQLDQHPRPTSMTIQGELNRALATSIWGSVFGLSHTAISIAMRSNPPEHFAFVLEGSGAASDLYVSGFAIGYGNVYSDAIHGFASRDAKYVALGTAGSELDSSIPEAVRLRSFGAHEVRFLAWGLHIGSPEGLTTIAVYRFDAKTLQAVWMRQNVPGAKVTLQQGLVVVESHSHVFANGGAIFHYSRKVYQQVPTGLKRLTIQRWSEH